MTVFLYSTIDGVSPTNSPEIYSSIYITRIVSYSIVPFTNLYLHLEDAYIVEPPSSLIFDKDLRIVTLFPKVPLR